MPKIAMIDAGSIVFAKTLFKDIVATSALKDSEFRFMSRTMPKLERLKTYADRAMCTKKPPRATEKRRACGDRVCQCVCACARELQSLGRVSCVGAMP
ncbi:MAG: hypothetical protein ACLFTT_11985 [Candidatus Hydrogenedentota bacterium]